MGTTKRAMSLKVGDEIPSVEVFENNPGNAVNMKEFCTGKKVVVFAVPGAFTPGCSKTHLPGYVEKAADIKAKGIDEIVCVSVNDPFVMGAWGQAHKADGKVLMLADTKADFARATGLEVDLKDVLGSVRCKRFAMIIEDGVVKDLQIEPDGTGMTCSLVENIITKL